MPDKNRPFYSIDPALTTLSQDVNDGMLGYHALLVWFNRRFANGFSFASSHAFGQAIDLDSSTDGFASFTDDDARNRGPAAGS